MRRFTLALGLTLLLSACATRPAQPVVEPPKAAAAVPVKPRNTVVGLSASELVGHFGNPALQVREGAGLKLQFRSSRCVLDAYLYPPESGSGVARVTYIDTRLPSGAAADQAACILALENPS
ncbi:MAG TPA: hypothetical protein VF079_11315 [Sphingomicrobium sp.]